MFDNLFSPLEIGEIEIKNRIQVTPHEQQYLENGLPSDTMIHYYIERAMGGAGLLEVSQIYIKASLELFFPTGTRIAQRDFHSSPILLSFQGFHGSLMEFMSTVQRFSWSSPLGLIFTGPSLLFRSNPEFRSMN
jgi:hypothetical protein